MPPAGFVRDFQVETRIGRRDRQVQPPAAVLGLRLVPRGGEDIEALQAVDSGNHPSGEHRADGREPRPVLREAPPPHGDCARFEAPALGIIDAADEQRIVDLLGGRGASFSRRSGTGRGRHGRARISAFDGQAACGAASEKPQPPRRPPGKAFLQGADLVLALADGLVPRLDRPGEMIALGVEFVHAPLEGAAQLLQIVGMLAAEPEALLALGKLGFQRGQFGLHEAQLIPRRGGEALQGTEQHRQIGRDRGRGAAGRREKGFAQEDRRPKSLRSSLSCAPGSTAGMDRPGHRARHRRRPVLPCWPRCRNARGQRPAHGGKAARRGRVRGRPANRPRRSPRASRSRG